MDVDAGFLVVLFVALGMVVMPSTLIAIRLWNSGLRGRALLACSCLLLVFLGVGAFLPDPEFGAELLENRVVSFMAIWGFLLYLSVGFATVLAVIFRLGRKVVQASTQNKLHD
jgi:hypothetical protein